MDGCRHSTIFLGFVLDQHLHFPRFLSTSILSLLFVQENINLDPEDEKTQKKISVAIKGLSQLRMYDEDNLGGGNKDNPNWNVHLEQNPMPKPDHL